MHKKFLRTLRFCLLQVCGCALVLTDAHAGWYLYINPNTNPEIHHGVMRVSFEGGVYAGSEKRSERLAQLNEARTPLVAKREQLEADKKISLGVAVRNGVGGRELNFWQPFPDRCASQNAGFVGGTFFYCCGLCYPCVYCLTLPLRRRWRAAIDEIAREITDINEIDVVLTEVDRTRALINPSLTPTATVYSGLYYLEDLPQNCGNFERVRVSIDSVPQRDLVFNLQFSEMTSGSDPVYIRLGSTIDFGAWGDKHKDLTADVSAELRELDVKLAIIKGSHAAQGGSNSNTTDPEKTDKPGDGEGAAFAKAAGKAAGIELGKMVGRTFGLPL